MSNIFSAAKQEPPQYIQGWGWVDGIANWHYFIFANGLVASMCGTPLTPGSSLDDDPLTDDAPANCLACKSEVEKMRRRKSNERS